MKARAFWTVSVVTINMAFVITACGGASAPTTAPTSAPAATLAPKPTATLSSTPVPSNTTSPTATLTTTTPGGFPVGTYAPDHKLGIDWIRFDADGKWVSALLPADAERAGRYIVDGDKITFLTDVGICQPFQSIYHWKTNGNVLTFVVIDEQCTASSRQADLTGRSWIKQP